MQRAELMALMERLTEFYDRFVVTDEKVTAWYRIFKDYETKTFEMAVDEYAASNGYAPTPDKLKKAYWDAQEKEAEQRQERLRRLAIENAKKGETCPYCHGSGYFHIIDSEGYGNVAPCKCAGEIRALNYYLNPDNGYKWQPDHRGGQFEPLNGWIGDELQKQPNKQVSGQAVIDFAAAVKNMP